jgi:hypothetical protein
MADPKPIVLAARAVSNASGEGLPVVLAPDRSYAVLSLDVDSLSDDSAFELRILTATTLAGAWTEIFYTKVQGPGAQEIKLARCGRLLKAKWTFPLGVSSSFELAGVSHQLYATGQDVKNLSLPQVTLEGVSPEVLGEVSLVATDEAASLAAKGRTMPLVSWGGAMRMHVANMIAYHVMKRRGFDPDNDKIIRMGYDDALKWLAGPGAANDPTIEDSTPGESAQESFMVSRPARGWAHR